MDIIRYHHFQKALTCQPFFIWHSLGEEIEDEEMGIEHFWDANFSEVDLSASQVKVQTFSKLEKYVLQKLSQEFSTIVLSGSLEERANLTLKYLNQKKVLINPVFVYQNVYATPLAFDPNTNLIINVSYTSKTKRKDFLRAYYDYQVISLSGTEVKDYGLFVLANTYNLKHDIALVFTHDCHVSKQGDYPGATKANGDVKNINIIDQLKAPTSQLPWPNWTAIISRINQSQQAKIAENLFYDTTYWGDNKEWNLLLNYLNHPLANFVGYVQKKKEIAQQNPINSQLYQQLIKYQKPIINNFDFCQKFLTKIKQASKIVWYDFEGYSLPFAAVDNTKAYQQIVFQVSIINTLQGKEAKPLNYVWDPLKITKDELFEILKAVYQNQANLYIVYNKTYENTRLKEIVELLAREQDEKFAEAQKMYDYIIDHTLDLYDLFRVSASATKVPPILLPDQKGKASIKNIEKHINVNNLGQKINYQIKPYHTLEIKQGIMAMEVAIKRAVGIIGEAEWKKVVTHLQKYCENDVRAMLMVYHFVNYLLKNYDSN